MARRTLHKMRAEFFHDLALSLEEKTSLFKAISKLEVRARRREPLMAPLYFEILSRLESGSLALAMNKVVSPVENLILDAVQTGSDIALADGLKHLAGLTEQIDAMSSLIRKAIFYPAILLTLFAMMATGFSFFAVPVLEQLLPPEKWPPLGQGLYFVASAIRSYGVFLIAAIVAAVFMFAWSLPNWTSPTRRWLDKFLPFSIYRDYNSALIIVALGCMMRANISVRSSLERSIEFASPWMRWHLRTIIRRLATANSSSFGLAFQTGLLSSKIEDRIEDAGERVNPVDSFIKIGNGIMFSTSRSLEKTASRLNALLMALCGLSLLLMMAGFFTTAFELQRGIKAL